MSLIDHIEIPVADGASARAFYTATLGVLGMSMVIDIPANERHNMRCGFGVNGYPCFWIHDNKASNTALHIAFRAETHQQVDAMYALALQFGGASNGEPGIRHHYHDHYYAAYVFDLDGNNVEFVCQS